jgi:hypothetical protein
MLTGLYDLLCCLKDDRSFGVQMMIVQILDKYNVPYVFLSSVDCLDDRHKAY